MDSKYVLGYKDKKAAAKIIDIKIVQHQKGISKDQQEIKSKPKDEVFEFGAVARKAATYKIKYQINQINILSMRYAITSVKKMLI